MRRTIRVPHCGLGSLMPSLSHADVIAMMQPAGCITIDGDEVIVHLDTTDQRPAVYAWVIGSEVIYIGKAGRGLKRRARQWQQGFRAAGRGGTQAARLVERSERVTWMAFWPSPVPFAGTMIASHSSVEEWLIDACKPTPFMNREARKR